MAAETLILKEGSISALGPNVHNEKSIEEILWSYQNIKTLIFEENSLSSVKFLALDGLSLPSLENLSIALRDTTTHQSNVLLQISRINMPNLDSLRIDSVLLSGDEDCVALYANIYELISHHSTNLVKLDLRHSFKPFTRPEASTLTLVPTLPWNQEKKTCIVGNLANLCLEALQLHLDRYEGQGELTLGLQILSQQTTLKKLEVQIGYGDVDEFYKCLQKAVEQNCKTLNHLCIFRNNITASAEELKGVLHTVAAKCTRLESLRLFAFKILNLPAELPRTLKFIDISGTLHPHILLQIMIYCPLLQELQFANLTGGFLENSYELRRDLTAITNMKYLKLIKWFYPLFPLQFLEEKSNVEIKTSPCNAHASFIMINQARVK